MYPPDCAFAYSPADLKILARAARVMEKREFYKGAMLVTRYRATEFLRVSMTALDHEQFWVMWINQEQKLIGVDVISKGTINCAVVPTGAVVRAGIRANAVSAILAHNHPSGASAPSQADIALTQRLVLALLMVDIRVDDHVIIGKTRPYSFAQHGLLTLPPMPRGWERDEEVWHAMP